MAGIAVVSALCDHSREKLFLQFFELLEGKMAHREWVTHACEVHRKIICPSFAAGKRASGNDLCMILALFKQDFVLLVLGASWGFPAP